MTEGGRVVGGEQGARGVLKCVGASGEEVLGQVV